jgi:hypothetical protein
MPTCAATQANETRAAPRRATKRQRTMLDELCAVKRRPQPGQFISKPSGGPLGVRERLGETGDGARGSPGAEAAPAPSFAKCRCGIGAPSLSAAARFSTLYTRMPPSASPSESLATSTQRFEYEAVRARGRGRICDDDAMRRMSFSLGRCGSDARRDDGRRESGGAWAPSATGLPHGPAR